MFERCDSVFLDSNVPNTPSVVETEEFTALFRDSLAYEAQLFESAFQQK